MPSVREEWVGCFTNRRADRADVKLKNPIRRGNVGGSRPFLAATEDGGTYWVKPVNNPQGPRVPASEQIVGRLFAFLGGPVTRIRTAEIPAELAGWAFTEALKLEVGIAHACENVPDAIQIGALQHRTDDTNAARHAYVLAMYDLCWGDDPQWLVQTSAENQYFSHDHGFYLPPGGQSWTQEALLANISTAHEYTDPLGGASLDRATLTQIAERLEALTTNALVDVIAAAVPASWTTIADADLEVAGHFILHRAPLVAERLRARWLRG